jgi:RimJ/RimL family protein N-acetyltransferase
MKARNIPKIWCVHKIFIKREEVGYIQLVSYLTGGAKPHIEYHVKAKYQHQGIMSKELPKYLKYYQKYNPQLIAVCKNDNIASMRILEKNGFIKIKNIDDNICYIRDSRFTPEIIEKMVRIQKESFPIEQEY